MVKNSFIEKTYVVGTHWNCLIEAIQCVPTTYVTVKRKKTIWKFTYFKYHVHCLYLFKHPKLPISIKIPVTTATYLYLHDRFISKLEIMNYLFANLLVAWV